MATLDNYSHSTLVTHYSTNGLRILCRPNEYDSSYRHKTKNKQLVSCGQCRKTLDKRERLAEQRKSWGWPKDLWY